jgi:Cyclophilin type peptidyl-prolyl cis-trans isomerase/CLD
MPLKLTMQCSVEEDMVDGFPYEVPEEYSTMPLLKGRATVDMKVKIKDNPNLQDCVFRIVLDGYNAPVTAGNFLDLVERHFYDGMEIQRGVLLSHLSPSPHSTLNQHMHTRPHTPIKSGVCAPARM